jgi:hypothetical protein
VPLPSLPTGVELDLHILGLRQRGRALGRALVLLVSSWFLVMAAVGLFFLAGGMLISDGASAGSLALLAASPISAGCSWLVARRALGHLRRAFSVRRALDAARLRYEKAVLDVEMRRLRP